MEIDDSLKPADLLPAIDRMWALSAAKLDAIERDADPAAGAPVFTVAGRYTSRGWTEWTQGFRYGSQLLQFDATGQERFLAFGRSRTLHEMAGHVSHIGVHDHGFTVVSTYGNLWRLTRERRLPDGEPERGLYELALRVSGAVQAARWRETSDGGGYIYSFNGPQSLFVDTVRTCRALALAHLLGHTLLGEGDRRISLLGRAIQHLETTARRNIWYGDGRDAYDLRGRTSHEALFNVNDGTYRCPGTQQGWSPFSTWTRGLAWAVVGYPEQLEFLDVVPDGDLEPFGGRARVTRVLTRAALATADHYLEHTARDGIPYWDTAAPGLPALGDWRGTPADPFNAHEPVDSSAAAIAAQGLLRLAHWLRGRSEAELAAATEGEPAPPDPARYRQAGLTVAARLLAPPYLSDDPEHHGLLLHTVYHRPNGWDHIAAGQRIPNGEAAMWGDYHLRELALYLQREARGEPYLTFFGPSGSDPGRNAASAGGAA